MWGTRRRKILIVAAPGQRAGLHPAFLDQPDIQLMKVAPGQEARALAQAEHPRLIVQNVGDPREDSLALTRQFKRDRATRSVPIIAVTGEELRQDDPRGRRGHRADQAVWCNEPTGKR